MRYINKYKLYENFMVTGHKLPKRVKNFKRSKWKDIKKKFWFKWVWIKKGKRSIKRHQIPNFYDFSKVRVKKKFYKNKVFTRKNQITRKIKGFFDNSIKVVADKNKKTQIEKMASIWIKPMFRVDNFLWYMKHFISPWMAKKVIIERNLLVNGKPVGMNYYLKKGDILDLDIKPNLEPWNRIRRVKSTYYFKRWLFPFVEWDYYTNTFFILKGVDDLSLNDLSLLIKEKDNVLNVIKDGKY